MSWSKIRFKQWWWPLGAMMAIEGTPAQQATVNFRMQSLEPAIHHFREASVISDFHHGNTIAAQQFGGAAGGQDFYASFDQGAGEIEDAGLVGNADKGAVDGESGCRVHGGESVASESEING